MAAPDVKKVVEIALQITGASQSTITKIAGSFTAIKSATDSAILSVDKLQTSLEKLKAPKYLDTTVTSLKELNKVKAPNIKQIIEGFDQLSKMKKVPSLSKFVLELERFSKVKLPNVLQIATGMKEISSASLDMQKVSGRIRVLVRNLSKFKDVSVPNITKLVTGLKKFAEIRFGSFPGQVTIVVEALKQFSTIKLPAIASLASGLKRLIDLDVAALTTKIKALNRAFAELDKRGHIKAFATFANDLNTVRRNLETTTKSVKKSKDALDEFGNSARGNGLKLKSFGDRVRTVLQFRLISDALAAVKDSFQSAITTIFEYDQALKDLQAITGSTTLQVELMGEKILEVASRTKFSASEVAQGMRVIGQAGFTASEAIETMQAVADLATGTLSDMSTTVDLITTAMRVFSIDATKSAQVADVFANAVNRSKLTVDKLRTAMNYIGPIAREAGVKFAELSAAMGTLANSGLRASTIGTGLRRVFAELVDPSKKLSAAARRAGISLRELDPRATSLSEVLKNLRIVVSDTQVAFDIFGKRGAAAALALSRGNNAFNRNLELMQRQGTAAEQAAKQMEGLAVSFKNLKDKLGLLAIALGELGITDALRLLINVSRTLVDVLTYLAGTTFVKFVAKAVLLTTAIYAIAKAFVAIKLSVILFGFGAMTAAMSIFVKATWSAVTAMFAFDAALGPVYIALIAITGAATVLYQILKDDSATASDEAAKLAIKYEILAKRMRDYSKEVIRNVAGSKELLDENKKLRSDLIGVAGGYTEFADKAGKAAQSIDPLTGKIIDGSKAIHEYNEAINQISMEKLIESANLANIALEKSTGRFSRYLNSLKDSLSQILHLYDIDYVDSVEAAIQSSRKLAIQIQNNGIGFEDLAKKVAKWSDFSRLTAQQKEIKEHFDRINERAMQIVDTLRTTNAITLEGTEASFKKAAEAAGATGLVFDGVIVKLLKLKELSASEFENIIEKWSQNIDVTPIKDFVSAYETLGGMFKMGEKDSILQAETEKRLLAEKLNRLKTELEADLAAGGNKHKLFKIFFAEEQKLLLDAQKIRETLAGSRAAQNIIALAEEQERYQQVLRNNMAATVDQLKLQYKGEAKLLAEHEKRKRDIIAGTGTPEEDFTDANNKYKNSLKEREIELVKHLEQVVQEEAAHEIKEEKAREKKLKAQLEFYRVSLAEARKYLLEVSVLESPKEYQKRYQIVLAAEKKFYEERTKIAQESGEIATEVEINRIENANSIREALYQASLKRQKDQSKTLLAQIKADRDIELDGIHTYYEERKALAEKNAQEKEELVQKEQEAIEASLAALVAQSNSESEITDLKAEKQIELVKLTQNLNEIDQERIQILAGLSAAENKEVDALNKRIKATENTLKDRIDKLKDADVGDTIWDKHTRELEALDRKQESEYEKLVTQGARIEQLAQVKELQDQERRTREKQQEKESHDYKVDLAQSMTSKVAGALKDMYDSGLIQSKKAFRAYQALAITETIINTYKSATAAYAAMAGIPYVGPALGVVAAAAAIASGMAQVAQIKSQQPSYAYGGEIQGPDRGPRADNVSINATPGEHMIDRPTTGYYGHDVFDAIRKKMVPRESLRSLMGLRGVVPRNAPAPSGRTGYADGGRITPQGSPVKEEKPISIVNIIDPNLFDRYLAGASGQNAVLNVLSNNATNVNRILER